MNTQNTNTQNHNHIGILETQTAEAAPQALPPDSRSLASISGSTPPPPPFSPLSPVNPSSRRLTGEVAQLPHHIRTKVNQWLYDGVTYRKICANLEQLGYPGFVHQYIQRWTKRGYQLWLHEREQRRYRLPLRLDRGEGRGEVSSCECAGPPASQKPIAVNCA